MSPKLERKNQKSQRKGPDTYPNQVAQNHQVRKMTPRIRNRRRTTRGREEAGTSHQKGKKKRLRAKEKTSTKEN